MESLISISADKTISKCPFILPVMLVSFIFDLKLSFFNPQLHLFFPTVFNDNAKNNLEGAELKKMLT